MPTSPVSPISPISPISPLSSRSSVSGVVTSSSGSGSSLTRDADPNMVLTRESHLDERGELKEIRWKLTYSKVNAWNSRRIFNKKFDNPDATVEELTYQANKSQGTENDHIDKKTSFNNSRVVKSYNKGNLWLTMNIMVDQDALSVCAKIRNGPKGRHIRDVCSEYMDPILKTWEPRLLKVDDWQPEEIERKRLRREYETQKGHREHARANNLKTKQVNKLWRMEEDCERKLKAFEAHLSEERMKFFDEKELQAERDLALSKSKNRKDKKRIETFYLEELAKLGIAGKSV